MSGEKVFLVDDTDDIRASIGMVLEKAGFLVETAADGPEALRKLYSFQPDLVLLDIMMPGMDGFAVLQRIRDISEMPIIMLTAVAEETEKVRAFEVGADDYVVKGTGMDELLARVNSALRRANLPPAGSPEKRYSDAEMEIDFVTQQIDVRGKRVNLTPKEYGVLAMLVRSDGSPITTNELLHTVWDSGYDPELVKWHIARLRGKIELDPSNPRLIVTRRGYGYVYEAPVG